MPALVPTLGGTVKVGTLKLQHVAAKSQQSKDSGFGGLSVPVFSLEIRVFPVMYVINMSKCHLFPVLF